MAMPTAAWLILVAILAQGVQSEVEDLCNVNGCSCNEDLTDVNCQCTPGQELSLGPETATNSQIALAPSSTLSLTLSGCQKLELLSKTFNTIPNLQNITIKDMNNVILHPRLYEARVGNGQSTHINKFEIENIHDLQVRRQTFESIRITGSFLLKSVTVQRTPSLAFAFDSVKEFSIMRSRFDRVSMWGFKLDECSEFNVLEESSFFSVASQAIHLKCKRFMLAYSTFNNLFDSSFGVKYEVADIQGNTFEKLTGKPFVDLRPLIETEPNNEAKPVLIFSENKFSCEPTLQFNAFAMPSFDSINIPKALVMIENNHFVCECDKMSWFLGAMTHNFDRDVIANGRGSLDFLQKLYDTAGMCLQCGLRRCDVTETSFHEFAQTALISHKNQLKCSSSGQPLKSQNPDLNEGFSNSMGVGSDLGEEEDSGVTRNMELLNNEAVDCKNSHLFSMLMALICLRHFA